MDEKILLEDRELVPPKIEYRSSRISHRLMDEKILLGDRELVPPKVEYRSSRISRRLVDEKVRGVMTPGVFRELVSKAARHMSLSPDYSIRRAFYLE